MHSSTHKFTYLCCFHLLGCWVCITPVHAQLFGARTVGQPLRSAQDRGGDFGAATTNAAGSAVGLLDGSERFVRGNRSRRDFVGSDRNEQTSFVGAGQAIGVGRVLSATEGLRVESSNVQRLNRPIPPQSSKGIYYPRLELGFSQDTNKGPVVDGEETADQRLRERIANVAGSHAQLILADRTAILRGSVSSSHTSKLTAQLLQFEPGIDRVQNELRVE